MTDKVKRTLKCGVQAPAYLMKNYLDDVAEEYQLGFQDAASPIMEGIINFNNYVYIYMSYVITLVIYMLVAILVKYSKSKRTISHKYLVHGTTIELV